MSYRVGREADTHHYLGRDDCKSENPDRHSGVKGRTHLMSLTTLVSLSLYVVGGRLAPTPMFLTVPNPQLPEGFQHLVYL